MPLLPPPHTLARRLAGVVGTRLCRSFARRHPRAATTMAELPAAAVLIEPVDLPFGLLITVGPDGPRLHPCPRGTTTADAVVRGHLAALIELAEGRIDGDALFFRRDLTIAGDTALVVALRNALDGEDIDIAGEIDAAAGPLGRFGPAARRHATRVAGVLGWTRDRLLRPAERRIDGLERRLSRLEKEGR